MTIIFLAIRLLPRARSGHPTSALFAEAVQDIRINGTLVGVLVGLSIFTVSRASADERTAKRFWIRGGQIEPMPWTLERTRNSAPD